ncbi:hypothetical protein [Exiguobacterium oxidotolerans]|uniref:hypothetical protein n=1 Tax=Exiguobacterium oxidotolerans TaxID=223958 RepID=UPI00133016CA|nr:hypothetical protein [Exiguobacterium oxidotolerans]
MRKASPFLVEVNGKDKSCSRFIASSVSNRFELTVLGFDGVSFKAMRLELVWNGMKYHLMARRLPGDQRVRRDPAATTS